jgi:hypothetical protein
MPENQAREVGEERLYQGGRGGNGGGNPSTHPWVLFYRQDRVISRAAPASSRQAPIRLGWRGKLDVGRRPRMGRRRPGELGTEAANGAKGARAPYRRTAH